MQARNRLQDLLADLRAEDAEEDEPAVPVGKRSGCLVRVPPLPPAAASACPLLAACVLGAAMLR